MGCPALILPGLLSPVCFAEVHLHRNTKVSPWEILLSTLVFKKALQPRVSIFFITPLFRNQHKSVTLTQCAALERGALTSNKTGGSCGVKLSVSLFLHQGGVQRKAVWSHRGFLKEEGGSGCSSYCLPCIHMV